MKTKPIITIPGMMLTALLLLSAVMPAPAFASENVPVMLEIPITYIVNGNAETAGGDRFILEPDDPEAPMPDDSEGGRKIITIREEGSCSFGSIYYDRPEIWWYTVSRELTDKKGVTKDDSVYRVKVIALNDGHGYVLAYLEGSDEKHEIVYTDRVAPDTGDRGIGLIIYAGMALAAAAALTAIAVSVAGNRKKEV